MSPRTALLRQAEGVQLADLVTAIARRQTDAVRLSLTGDPEVEVSSVTHDSRSVGPGSLFCCVLGAVHNGHDHAEAAVSAGAAAVLCERPLDVGVPELRTTSVRRAMGPVAATLAGDPSQDLAVIGVTGTNGKTTVTHLLGAIFEGAGWPHLVIGTLSGARTTPEAPELQEQLRETLDAGARAVAMEVSSHALDMHRVDGTTFAVGAFTNLSQDHLDHHGSLEAYFAAKASLFTAPRCRRAVINADDPHGARLLASVGVPAVSYSLDEVADLDLAIDHSTFIWRGQEIEVPLAGRFNVSNALAAATIAGELGIDLATIADGLAGAPPIAGRFERIDAGQPFAAVVDYAHTPDGLEQLLSAGRELAGSGRIIVVFGAGGDRDPAKRPLMGEVVDRLADVAVLTTDNARSEEPKAISAAVRAGMVGRADVTEEPDRAIAIGRAIAAARPGDLVLVAGKGHESTQTVGDQVRAFDDRDAVRAALVEAGYRPPVVVAS